jgi:hypothetical protein
MDRDVQDKLAYQEGRSLLFNRTAFYKLPGREGPVSNY